jgi:hypothetical protein
MITPTTLDKLAIIRREKCLCGFVGHTPEFHEIACPYVKLAQACIREAEQGACHD